MLCIGHRGARGLSPENTLASVELAITQGADAIEIDVREHDQQVIVFHDERVERTTNGQGYLTDFSVEQLRQLDAGSGQKIPTLPEVIQLINRRVPLNIELKDHQSVAPTLIIIEEFVARGWRYDDFVVSSFFHPLLQWLKAKQPLIPIGALSAGVMTDLALFAQQLSAVSINLCHDSINQEIIDDAHQRGLKVYIYTVNEVHEFEKLRAMAVDGLFTDYPQRLIQWRD